MKDLIRSKQKKQGTAKLAGALGLLLALGLIVSLVAVPAMALVLPQLPHRFYGEVTYQPSGAYVEAGARVSAEVDDPADGWVEVASTLVVLIGDVAWYDFDVPADNAQTPDKDGADPGDEIRFYVDGVLGGIWGDDPPGEMGFVSGDSDRLDLEVWLVTHDLTVTSDGCCPITVGELGEVAAGATDVFTIPEDTEVLLTADDSDPCCDFDEWVVDGGAPVLVNPISVTMDADHTAVATCSEVGLLTLTVDVVGEGDVEVDAVAPGAYPAEYFIECCIIVDLEAIPAVDWVFTGWSGDLGGTTNPTTIHMDENKTVTASFAPVGEPQDLTVTSDGCCTITVGGLGEVAAGATEVFPDITFGTEVLLTAVSPACCDFDEWVVDGGAPVLVNPISVTMDADHTAVATCSEVGLLTLTVDVVGEGDVEVDAVAPGAYPAEYFIECCIIVDLEAIPAVDWVFTGWSGDLGGTTNPTTIHMDENKTVTASFAPVGETNLTVNTTTEGTVTDPGVGTFPYDTGTVVPLVAEPDQCASFVNWTGNVGTVADVNDATTTILMNDDYEITANFVPPEVLTTIPLNTGWNTFATPIVLEPCSDTWDELVALSGLGDDVEAVYYYDSAAGYWDPVYTGYHDDVTPLEGFYVKLDDESVEPTVVIVPYWDNPDPDIPPRKLLATGLNFIGMPSLDDMALDVALRDIYLVLGVGYSTVYNPEENPNDWPVNNTYIRDVTTPIPTMVAFKAYWVIMGISEEPLYLYGSLPPTP